MNSNHYDALEDGMLHWLSQGNPDFRAELSGATLSHWQIAGVDLSKADMRGVYAYRTDLSGATLREADLREARLVQASLKGAILSGANLSMANLNEADLRHAELTRAVLMEASLERTEFSGAILIGADFKRTDLSKARFGSNAQLSGADLSGADLSGIDLRMADLRRSNLSRANLYQANLREADLREANLAGTLVIETDLTSARLNGCSVYGASVWKANLDGAKQSNLIVTPEGEPTITVDDLEVAQFIYLLLKREKLRNVIDTITSRAVLILGRFIPERKVILDAIAEEVRKQHLLPIIFDFERSTARDFTETIKILAGMALFVIADISNPKSAPLELQAAVPDYQVPFVPIIQEGEQPFSMFSDLGKYDWVLKPVITYSSLDKLREGFKKAIIDRAWAKHQELQRQKTARIEALPVDYFLQDDATQPPNDKPA
jgi:uncharacterized protein YjbI with pentapeptide repeats